MRGTSLGRQTSLADISTSIAIGDGTETRSMAEYTPVDGESDRVSYLTILS